MQYSCEKVKNIADLFANIIFFLYLCSRIRYVCPQRVRRVRIRQELSLNNIAL